MNNNYTIYCHRNKINNKAYIGQTGCVPYTKRWQGHGVSSFPYKKCRHFQNAINVYGWENFEHYILIDHLTLKQVNYYEKLFIALFNTTDPSIGYNIAEGGLNKTHSEETKRLIKEHHADFSGENHPMWGRHHSEETRKKISEARKGQKLTEETKQKLSEKMSGSKNPRAKKVLCIETGQIFNTAKDAGLWVNRNYSSICKVCNGYLNTCGGYHWQYI